MTAGTRPHTAALVTTDRLDVAAHEAAVASRVAGAVVSFAGVVRDHDHGRGVVELEYEAHPTAQQVLAEVAAEIAADWRPPYRRLTGPPRLWPVPGWSTR